MTFKEVECQVCHRLDFEGRSNCEICHWPIKPVTLDGPVFGYEVAVRVRVERCETAIVEKHFMTQSERVARNRAKRTKNFVEVAAVRPWTEEPYLRAFGDPRLTL